MSKNSEKKAGRGRPQLYPLTSNQEKSVRSKIAKGVSSRVICEELGIHPFAVLRVRRQINAEA